MMYTINIQKELLPYSFEIELNDNIYTLVVKYNERFDFFTIDLYLDDEIIIYGEKVDISKPLFLSQSYKEIPTIIPFDESLTADRITFENLSESVELYFIPDDEKGDYYEVLE